MKRKDGIVLKMKWHRILSPKQCFYDFKYMPERFTSCSETIGTIIMWIVFILFSPIIAIWYILDFPRHIIKFLYKAKTLPKERVINNRHISYFCDVIDKERKSD